MKRRRLIAAIGVVRAKLALLEGRLEAGDDEGALELLDEIETTWADAVEEMKAA